MKRNVQFEARVKIRILKIHSPFSIFPPLSPSFFHPSPSLSPLPPLLFLSFIASRFSLFVAVVKKSCPFNTRRVTSMKEPAECSRIKRSNCATGYHRLEQSDKKRESKAGTKRARDRSREREISRKFLNTFLDLELKFELKQNPSSARRNPSKSTSNVYNPRYLSWIDTQNDRAATRITR